MHRIAIFSLLMVLPLAAQLSDRPGFKDPPLFTRMPNYFLAEGGSFVESQFDSHEFRVKNATQRVEGHYLKYSYTFDESHGAPASQLQIIRNYQNAAKRIGGKVLWESSDSTTLLLIKDGKETWVDVQPTGGPYYTIEIVEREAMKQDVLADAAALQSGLAATGHVEVPGIFFDFGKSVVKPESEPALKELVKLLQTHPSVRVWVVGHTDNVGSAESNVVLSNARAAAVIQMLTQKMGIDPKRLAPHGSGPFSPVATNKTEEGRAKNRRVELVEQP